MKTQWQDVRDHKPKKGRRIIVLYSDGSMDAIKFDTEFHINSSRSLAVSWILRPEPMPTEQDRVCERDFLTYLGQQNQSLGEECTCLSSERQEDLYEKQRKSFDEFKTIWTMGSKWVQQYEKLKARKV